MNTDDFLSVTDTDTPSLSPMEVTAPEIPGYQINDLLGQGGMGNVWRATQSHPQREVALKQMNPQALNSKTALARFKLEVEVTARLEHPNIARVYDCALDQLPFYFTMELIKGQRLDHYVQAQDFNHRQIMQVIHTVCLAMAHAHQNGVIHRDLKPSNILVTKDGQPHIVDFGVAKCLDDNTRHLTVSDVTRGPGTLVYMSPEQVTGKAVDTRTDIYALGIIAYRLLTRRFPYDVSGSDYACMQHIERHDPISPRRLVKTIDADLEAILLTALAKDPAERYQSASELARDIDNWLQGRALSIKSTRTLYVLKKLMRKHQYTSTVMGLLAVILLSFSLVSTYTYKKAQRAQRQSQLVADQWRAESQRQLKLSTEVTFARFLELWHQNQLNQAQYVINFLPTGTKEKAAAQFLLDPNVPTNKQGQFQAQLGDESTWFFYGILGEDYFKRGQLHASQQAFEQSYQAIPADLRGDAYRFDNLFMEHIRARLFELNQTDQ